MKKLKQCIEDFNRCELKKYLIKDKDTGTDKFDAIAQLITNDKIIKTTNNLLSSLLDTEINKFENKSFLSSFMIKYNHKEVFA